MKIGVISDTHGHLDSSVARIFAGVDHILHGGDIGSHAIITELAKIAPVTAVLGNNDSGLEFRETEIAELAGRKFLVHHIVAPNSPAGVIRGRIESEQPDVVVFGHTHRPFCGQIGNVLYFNPGYAGRPRFALERTVALLEVDGNGLRSRFIRL
jgi:putative phosphoesterase